MIVVTGATGQLGRQVVEHLLARVPADQIGASVRDPAKAHDLEKRGVRVRRGDFADPASLADAFEGASRVLVVSANELGETAIRLNGTAIEAAKAAGVRRVFYTSHVGVSSDSPFPPMHAHAATEAALHELGVPFTILRNGFYAQSLLRMLGDAPQTGEVRMPEDGPVSWTTHADLAEATAAALTDDSIDEPTLALTAAEAIDLSGVAEIAAELTGRPIRRVVVPDDEYRENLRAQGLPDTAVTMTMGLLLASRRGEFARVDPTLSDLIGRPPTPLREVLRAGLTPG